MYAFTQYTINGKNKTFNEIRGIRSLIRKMKSAIKEQPVYQISIKKIKSANDYGDWSFSGYNTIYTFYIADKIQLDSELAGLMNEKYDKIYTMPDVIGKPAILTEISDTTHILGGIRSSANPRFAPVNSNFRPGTEVNVGKTIDWHVLDKNKDIVVDKNLHQIWPIKIGKYPIVIQNLLKIKLFGR